MTLATIKGRLQTKLVTFIILGLITWGFLLVTGNLMYAQLFLVAIGAGLVLELIWGVFIVHQPGWLTFVLAGVEFAAIAAIAAYFEVPATMPESAWYYLTSWALIQLFLLYVLPIWRVSWVDDGRELW